MTTVATAAIAVADALGTLADDRRHALALAMAMDHAEAERVTILAVVHSRRAALDLTRRLWTVARDRRDELPVQPLALLSALSCQEMLEGPDEDAAWAEALRTWGLEQLAAAPAAEVA